MPKQKNALRKHYIAPWTPETATQEPEKEAWKWLADGVTTADVESDEETDDVTYYNGDGTKKTVVTGVKHGYSFEGDYIKEDAAQKIIADMRFKVGDARTVWFKIVESDGKTQYSGVATVSDIKIGGGEASEFEKFEATVTWDSAPKQSAVLDVL
ncbi:tail shaft protein [Streptococcus porcinus]|uniref:phage tail tube protein n=1 Tax=Streptococcus porcinus TaxID=1340 RepID=UPI0010CAD042|nr:phage tail protein [Streptococcus porcinus]VTS32655.1 tail shaft protein [Streptococcus porcinus]